MDEELLRIIDLFDNEEVTTADKIDPPENPYRDFMNRNPQAKGGRIGFQDGLSVREKNLIKKRFPEADFTKGKFGFKKGDPNYETARYVGKRFKDRKERTLKESKDPIKVEQKRLKAKEYYSTEKENILERARKKYEVDDNFRKQVAAQNKKNQLKIVNERGLFPPGQKPQDNIWHDLYRSSQAKGGDNRFILDKKFIDNVPKKEDGTPRWAKDNYYRTLKFKDAKTGKTITYNGMKKYLDNTFGKGTYDKALNGYKVKTDLRDTRIKVRGKEQKLGTVLRDAVRAQGNVNVNSVLEVHHPFGIKQNWWDNQVVFRDANRKLNLINNKLTRAAVNVKDDVTRKKLFTKFGKEVDKLPGGISLFFEGKQVGTKTPTSESVIRGAAKTIKDPAITRAVNQLSLNAKIPGITELFEMAKGIPDDLKKAKYLKAGFKALGIGVAPLVIYDTYNNYTQGKPILETLEQGVIGTDIIGGTKRFLALTPEERKARSVVKQDALKDLNVDMPMGFGFIEGPTPQTDLTLEEAQAKAAAGDERVKALEAQRDFETKTNRANFFGNIKDNILGAPQSISFAGGGIAGLSGGINKGPQRTSMNPDSQGLRSLRNRARNL